MNRILTESKIVILAAFALLFVTGRGNSVVYASGEASNRQMETLENSPWGLFDDEETSEKTSDENSVWDSFGWINDEESSLADPSTESEPVKPDTPSEEELLQNLSLQDCLLTTNRLKEALLKPHPNLLLRGKGFLLKDQR